MICLKTMPKDGLRTRTGVVVLGHLSLVRFVLYQCYILFLAIMISSNSLLPHVALSENCFYQLVFLPFNPLDRKGMISIVQKSKIQIKKTSESDLIEDLVTLWRRRR